MIPRPHDHNLTEHSLRGRLTADSLNRCFLSAYLLIGNSELAEGAVMDAIDLWDPGEGDENQLFQLALEIAVRAQVTTSPLQSNREYSADFFVPIELRRVLDLPSDLRFCFVLRMLAGLPSQVCAEMVDSDLSHINQRTCDAVRHLTTLTYSIKVSEETCRINTRFL